MTNENKRVEFLIFFFFFQAEDGIRDIGVTGVQTCALPISCYSSPFLLEKPGAPAELVVVSTKEISGYDPDTGVKNWGWAWKFTAKMPLRTKIGRASCRERV